MSEDISHERMKGFFTGPCCPMAYGPVWSVPFWPHKLSKKEEITAMKEYAKGLEAELEEVNKEIKSSKGK